MDQKTVETGSMVTDPNTGLSKERTQEVPVADVRGKGQYDTKPTPVPGGVAPGWPMYNISKPAPVMPWPKKF